MESRIKTKTLIPIPIGHDWPNLRGSGPASVQLRHSFLQSGGLKECGGLLRVAATFDGRRDTATVDEEI